MTHQAINQQALNNQRVYNFSPGPSMLPTQVLETAQLELLNYRNSGMSVMEISHRGALFNEIVEQAIADFKKLYHIPDNYHVIFTQGGATAQNSLILLNLLKNQQKAAYAITGHWSKRTYEEALRYQKTTALEHMHVLKAIDVTSPYQGIPSLNQWAPSEDLANSAYLHLCTNETIDGVQFSQQMLSDMTQKYQHIPLVLDMSSDILSQRINISDFAVIYGGAQKNIGISGLTFLIIREDLIDQALDICPKVFNWQAIQSQNSLLNTPSTFAIYLAGLVFRHWLNLGGLDYIEQQNKAKAQALYQAIDESQMYQNTVSLENRSMMNVVFSLKNDAYNSAFLDQANLAGLTNLKGHKQVGGMRASIYNAMPIEGVYALIDFMKDFEKKHNI
jgi:phosphoserine aminotransferase